MRRDRAARLGPALFLFERAFEDCLERLSLVDRRFGSAMLLGCPDPGWPGRLREVAEAVDTFEPGPLFAERAGGSEIIEDSGLGLDRRYDLCLAIGTLDTVNDLPAALRWIGGCLAPNALLLGAVSGGDTLPALRSAMRSADAVGGGATPHIHPRIEASALAPLLAAAGFTRPVVDIDRVRVSYPNLQRLAGDLRAMGATNILCARSKSPLGRREYAAATAAFAGLGDGSRTEEVFEILHFAAWLP